MFRLKLTAYFFFLCSAITFSANATVSKFELPAVGAAGGQTIFFPIKLINNTAVSAVQFEITYDSSRLTSFFPVKDDGDSSTVEVLGEHRIYSPQTQRAPGVRLVVVAPDKTNLPLQSGNLFYIPFKVLHSADSSDTTITLNNVVVTGSNNIVDVSSGFIGRDSDRDGAPDTFDDLPYNPYETKDTDGDGIGNNTDEDDDNDKINDEFDLFPLDATEWVDSDGDGIGNNADDDDDNDGVKDIDDALPADFSDWLDSDGDGTGNLTDDDDDNDGIKDSIDDFPLDPTNGANLKPNVGDFGYVYTYPADIVNDYSFTEWQHVRSSEKESSISDFETDVSGNIYHAGSFSNTIDFDQSQGGLSVSPSQETYEEAYVLKKRADGSIAWVWRTEGGVWDGEGFSESRATGVAVDANGNVYVVGYYDGTKDFNPNPNVEESFTAVAKADVFYAKLDSNGNLLWVRTIGGDWYDYVYDVALDSQNNLYYFGEHFSYFIDFDSSSGIDEQEGLGSTMYLTRINADGTYGWTHIAGGNDGLTRDQYLEVDKHDRIYIGGTYYGAVAFDANDRDGDGDLNLRTANYYFDGFVFQLDADGNFNWVWTAGGDSGVYPDQVRSIKSNETGVYIAGDIYGVVDFDSNGAGDYQGVIGEKRAFLTYLHDDGQYGKTSIFDGYTIMHLDSDPTGSLYLAGIFSSTVDFDPSEFSDDIRTPTEAPDDFYDVFISKFLVDGSYDWTKTLGGYTKLIDIAVTNDAFVYLTGSFSNTVDFDLSDGVFERTAVSAQDVYMLQLTPRIDTDDDGLHNSIDPDDDNDYIPDIVDTTPFDSTNGLFDSDKDGIVDGYEYRYGLDPFSYDDAVADNDGDGLSNFQEFLLETNPNVAYEYLMDLRAYGSDGNNPDKVLSIATDSKNNTYILAKLSGTANLETKLSSLDYHVSEGVYLFKLEFGRNLTWVIKLIDGSNDIVIDKQDNIYVVSDFNGTHDFNQNGLLQGPFHYLNKNEFVDIHSSIGGKDIAVTKLDSAGAYVWTKTFGGTGNEEVTEVVVDELGNLYISGAFDSPSVDFDIDENGTDIRNNQGSDDLFVTRWNADGSYGWTYTVGNAESGKALDLVVDDNNVYVTGYYRFDLDFDPSIDSEYHRGFINTNGAYISNIFLTSLNSSSGSYNWTRSIIQKLNGGSSNGFGRAVALDNVGNIYVAGEFNGQFDFSGSFPNYPNPTSTTYTNDTFVVRYDSAGEYLGAKLMINADGDTYVSDFAIDENNTMLLSGSFRGGLSHGGDPATTYTSTIRNNGEYEQDGYYTYFTWDDSLAWTQVIGSEFDDESVDIIEFASDGSHIIAGMFGGNVDINRWYGDGVVESHNGAISSNGGIDFFVSWRANDAGQDKDGDGLSNFAEFSLGTDPTLRSSDDDPLSDGLEVAYGLNPLVDDTNLDSDGDGLSNINEFLFLSDPFVADSDFDGFPDGADSHPLDPSNGLTDVDGDGLSAGEEYALGTSDNNVDSDGDGELDSTDPYPIDAAPMITLIGSNTLNLFIDDPFVDDGATANDFEDGDLTQSIVVAGVVDTSRIGSYNLEYSITDSQGDSVSVIRTVNVFSPETVSFSRLQTLVGSNSSYTARYVSDMHVDEAGNIYIGGTFKGSLDFDYSPGDLILSGGSYSSIYVYKTNSDGTFAWAWKYGKGSVAGVTSDNDGNVYVTGTIPGISYGDADRLFIAKLSPFGELLWSYARTPGGSSASAGSIAASDLVVDSLGNVYVVGRVKPSYDDYEVYVTKLDANGELVWTHSVNGTSLWGEAITIDTLNNIYMAGKVDGGVVNFDINDRDGDGNIHTKSLSGNNEAFVFKLSADGYFNWVWTTEGSSSSDIRHLQVVGNELKLVGTGTDIINFDSNGVGDTFGSSDLSISYITTLSLAGIYINTQVGIKDGLMAMDDFGNPRFAGDYGIASTAFATANNGNIYLAGNFNLTTDFDPGIAVVEKTPEGTYDNFVLLLSENPDMYRDTDGDSLSDNVENSLGLNPLDGSDAHVDTDGDGLLNIDEYHVGSNIFVSDNFDLSVSIISEDPSSVLPGEDFVISSTVMNTGQTSIAGYTVDLYISTDDSIDTNDIHLGSWLSVVAIANGEFESQSVTITMPSSFAAGDYYIGAIVDSTDTVVETNELNNTLATVINVAEPASVSGVDLLVTSATMPTTVSRGSYVQHDLVVKNQGDTAVSGYIYWIVYMSQSPEVTTSDTGVYGAWQGRTWYTSFLPGESIPNGDSIQIPSVTPGQYYIGTYIQWYNDVNQSNNWYVTPITIQ